jgi:hypothetical protein
MLKTVSSITNAIGALNYKGTWNASTNTPTLASGVGTKGDYYVVSVAGNTALDGISNWGVGDWAVFNGSAWQRVEGGADLNGVNLTFTGTASGPTYETSNTVAGLTISNNDIVADGIDANIDIDITPKGTGEVNLPKVDIDGGAIDAVTLGTNSPVTEAQVDNLNINGNTISSTNTNGNVIIAPNGTGATQLGSKNGLNTATPDSPLSLASSYKRDGSVGSSFDVFYPISVMTVKDADAASLAVATSNPNNALTLAAGTDITLANVGIVRTESSIQAEYASSVLRQCPTGYSTAVRIIIVGDEATTGDASATAVLMRQSINNGGTWTDWQFRTSYYHNFWGQRYVIVGPWQALKTTDDNVPAVFQLGVRAASTKDLRYTKLMIMHAYVKLS